MHTCPTLLLESGGGASRPPTAFVLKNGERSLLNFDVIRRTVEILHQDMATSVHPERDVIPPEAGCAIVITRQNDRGTFVFGNSRYADIISGTTVAASLRRLHSLLRSFPSGSAGASAQYL